MTETATEWIDHLKTELKVYRGMPVPWVARWSSEVRRDLRLDFSLVLDEHQEWPLVSYSDGMSVRGDDGILWQRDGLGQKGEPDFGQVNTIRQKASMVQRRCQVCGQRIKGDTTLFLVAAIEEMTIERTKTTGTPPVCGRCCEAAPEICPALKKHGWKVYEVKHYEPIAVFGQVYGYSNGRIGDLGVMDVPLGHVALRSTVGKQLTVRLEMS